MRCIQQRYNEVISRQTTEENEKKMAKILSLLRVQSIDGFSTHCFYLRNILDTV